MNNNLKFFFHISRTNKFSGLRQRRNYRTETEIQQVPQKIDSPTRNVECVEVEFPLGWGRVRGKWWGATDKRPILASHGWQDNCGTFDRLAPLLLCAESQPSILALDLPGHGYSSRYPIGFNCGIFDWLMNIKQIANYCEWRKISLIGHSFFGMHAMFLACLFPEEVDFFVGLDCFNIGLTHENNLHKLSTYRKRVKSVLQFYDFVAKAVEPPSYSYDQCIELYSAGTNRSVSIEFAPYILNRGLSPLNEHKDKFYFNRDARAKIGPMPTVSLDLALLLVKGLQCPTLLVQVEQDAFPVDSTWIGKILDSIRKTVRNLEIKDVKGSHHLHLEQPELVSDSICKFINKYESKDYSQKSNLIDKIYVKKYF